MCNYSERLIAWLDRELPEDEAAALGLHIRGCAECRSALESYKRVSYAFDAYCDAVCDPAKSPAAPRRQPSWIQVLSGAAAAAAVALLLILHRTPVEQPRLPPLPAEASLAVVPESAPSRIKSTDPIKETHRRRTVTRLRDQNVIPASAEPAIQIAVPAEAMFPPGAVPEGFNFTADMGMGPDGSVQVVRLRLRPSGTERRITQP